MRRSKQSETGPSTASAPPRPLAQSPGAPTSSDNLPDVLGVDDLERGRTAALLASLGRVQLTLDIIERRLGRLEETVAGLQTTLEDVPAQTSALLVLTATEFDSDGAPAGDVDVEVVALEVDEAADDEAADTDATHDEAVESTATADVVEPEFSKGPSEDSAPEDSAAAATGS